MKINDSRASFLHSLLYWERKHPDAIYLTQPLPGGGVQDYTWRQVGDEVRRMAAHLRTLQLPAGSAIAVVGKNSAHWIMADLAIMMAGHVSVPIYFTVNADTMRYVLEHSGARLIIIGKLDGSTDTWPDMRQGIPAELPKITLPFAPDVAAESWQTVVAQQLPLQDEDIPEPELDGLATIIYTSGSTGRPKGVMHNHRGLTSVANAMQDVFALNCRDRMLSYLPLAHAAERSIVESASLVHGFRVYFAGNLDTFVEDLQRARPTLFFSVPRLWVKFQQGINEKLSLRAQRILFRLPVVSTLFRRRILQMLGLDQVRGALTGSAPLPPDVLLWYRQLGLELLEGYGMTENFAYSHASRPGRVRIGYVGDCCPGVECRIDSAGEILVKSPGTMMGYFKDAQKTAEDLTADGFLRTGDMGEIDTEGRLRITGRVKDLFKTSKGKYVAPVPIEQLLGNHPLIEAVCVAGSNLTQPVGLIMLGDLARDADRAAVQRQLERLLADTNAELEAHEKMSGLVVVGEPWTIINGLLTPTLKIKRASIEAHYADRMAGWGRGGQQVRWE